MICNLFGDQILIDIIHHIEGFHSVPVFALEGDPSAGPAPGPGEAL